MPSVNDLAPAAGYQIGTSSQPLDPLLGPLQDHGGSSWTHAPAANSPVIDAGNPAQPGTGGDACLLTDQRGVGRPLDGDGNGTPICDVGAYEAPPPHVRIQKTGPALVSAAAPLVTYTLVAHNHTPFTLTTVVITDALPAGTHYAGGGTLTGDVVQWMVPTWH